MRAVLLVGYGSVLPGIGTAMIRLAARISAAGIAPIAAAAFLSGCRPSFSEALANCIASGAEEIVVQPYTLVEDIPIRRELRQLVQTSRTHHPQISIHVARPLGDHFRVAQIAVQRALEADYAASHNMHQLPLLSAHESITARPPAALYVRGSDGMNRELIQDVWQPSYTHQPTGLTLIAHGSKPAWDWPITSAAEWIRLNARFAAVNIGYTQWNTPDIGAAIDQHVARGLRSLVLVPYMLQLTNTDSIYITEVAAEARARHPSVQLLIADHLNYDRHVLLAIGDRVSAAAMGISRNHLAI